MNCGCGPDYLNPDCKIHSAVAEKRANLADYEMVMDHLKDQAWAYENRDEDSGESD